MSIFKAVIIPVYKEALDGDEQISFTQCLRILGKSPIIIISPQYLNLDNYKEIASREKISIITEHFDGSFFQDLAGYNRLMLSKEFYSRFVKYNYILIYQLDAFVFKDEFDYWCSLGYDYVGAPWISYINKEGFSLFMRKLFLVCKNSLNRLLRKPNKVFNIDYRVGNGGFSLRNPKKFLEIIEIFERNGKIEKYRSSNFKYDQEDVFWAYEARAKLNIPSYKIALRFSIEDYPEDSYRINGGEDPFGCHAWRKYSADFWKPYIERFGYRI